MSTEREWYATRVEADYVDRLQGATDPIKSVSVRFERLGMNAAQIMVNVPTDRAAAFTVGKAYTLDEVLKSKAPQTL